ncbi:MAG TPA: polysaccharide biosynthesis protein [Anaerolineae bacterium]|nr:polysaccharide biosynthesis protein [Anaerolineae bacterium]
MANFLRKLRNRHFFLLDVIALAVIPFVALILRLDGFDDVPIYGQGLMIYTLLGMIVRLIIFWRAGLYERYWRYASIDEMVLITITVLVASVVNAAIYFALRYLPIIDITLPRSVPFIDAMLSFLAIGGTRISIRLAEYWSRRGLPSGRRVLIIGAGDAGVLIAREIQSNVQLNLDPIGFVDDDPAKQGMKIYGVLVLGQTQDLPKIVREYQVAQAIIAMPTAPGKTVRRIVSLCAETGVETKTIPGVYELISGRVRLSQIRDVDIEDLLRREPVKIETMDVTNMVRGKRVLITGAGGSIGSELCRQMAENGASELILLGHGEYSIFRITNELLHWSRTQRRLVEMQQSEADGPSGESRSQADLMFPPQIHSLIADIRDKRRLKAIFHEHKPHIVFHAAAHKHVPLMERNLEEAVSNNVAGTKSLIEAAEESGVERFVLISTDKAVNPVSNMGVTKRVAERLIEAAASRNKGVFVAVRFGNVLDSRGSVVRIFRQQIARGGPVTVTHRDMRRYFMTIPEAVQLVMQAAAMGQGGEIFVLDMGEPVAIEELAYDMIRLSGLEVGRDIDIEYSGIRPGEKMFEELFADSEAHERTKHEKIFVSTDGPGKKDQIARREKLIDELIDAARRSEPAEVRALLEKIVPEYRTSDSN